MVWTDGDLATAATAFVGLAALVRPDVSRAFRHWRSKIDVHPAGQIEIGFSIFGPTVGIQGTLRAIGRDEFVARSWMTIERISDHLRHDFEWAVFRPQAVSPPSASWEVAAGFLVSKAAPRRFNIQFHDTATAKRLSAPLTELKNAWLQHLQKKNIRLADVQPKDVRKEYDQFLELNKETSGRAYQAIDRDFYWVQGDYRLCLSVETSRPAKVFLYTYKFCLSEPESVSIRANVTACMLTACNVPDTIFSFALPAYQHNGA